jgi:hypothetical protein
LRLPSAVRGPGGEGRLQRGFSSPYPPQALATPPDAVEARPRAPRQRALDVSIDHPEIAKPEITVDPLRKGFVRVAIAVPEIASTGDYTITAILSGCQRAAGGIGDA